MKRKRWTVLAVFAMVVALLPLNAVPAFADTPIVTIMEIQGSGFASPFVGVKVRTTGIVTAKTASGYSFWMQDPDGDGDSSTSDGILVVGKGFLVDVGDPVSVEGKPSEYYGVTEFYRPWVDVLTTGSSLPSPVEITDLPDIEIMQAAVYWESLEGMLVSVENAPVVSATSRFGEFAMLTKTDAKPGSGYFPQTKQILIRSLGGEDVDYNPERILVDDSTLDDPIEVMPGDRVRSLVGVVDYTFGNYKLQPVSYDVETHTLPQDAVMSTRSGQNGDTVITTFNVENLFDLVLNTPTVVDSIGQIGFDPGSEWGSGLVSTRDNTLRRKGDVCTGDINPDDAFDPSLEWVGFAKDVFDGLGSHTVTCGTASDLLISEYVEGGSLNKAIEIYNGTGDAVDLAAGAYAIDIYFNGSYSVGTTISLSGTIAAGDVYVVADDGAVQAILDETDQTSTSNFFNGDDAVVLRKGGKDDWSSTPEPDELETQLSKLVLAIQVELGLPDIIVVQEVENTEIAQVLADRVNSATGTDYVATSFETSDGRGIEAGFLWDTNRVELLDAYQLSGPDVQAAFGPSSPSPGREPIYGMFRIGGKVVHIVGNHFKSKGGDDPLFGTSWPPVRITEVQRKLQAHVVRDFVNGILDSDPDALVMVAGDLNDFQFSEPGEGLDNPVAILEGGTGEVPLVDLINMEKAAERFTYVYDGNSQVLDHMLVSPALMKMMVGVDVLHFNAGIPASFSQDATTALRASDHDPLEGRFRFTSKAKRK